MKRSRRTFARDYKLAAVKKVIEQGLSYAEVARDLGIRDTLIHNWKKAFEADGTLAAEVNQSPSVEAERSFFKSFKVEEVYHEKYETHEQAVRAANDYIERFYNPKRLHSALDYVSPTEFEQRLMLK